MIFKGIPSRLTMRDKLWPLKKYNHMKILFLIHRVQARGQEIFACQLANELEQRGHEVKVWSLYSGDFQLPFAVQSFGFEHSGELWKPKNWKRLNELILDYKPEIVQANGGDTFKYMMLVNFRYGFEPKLLFNNGGVMSYYFKSLFQKFFYCFLLKGLDAVVSVSEYSDRDLSQFISAQIPRKVIPISVLADKNAVEMTHVSHPTFVHIGGFTPEKNQLFLIEIFKAFQKTHPSSELHFFGEGPLLSFVKKRVEPMNGIIFHGAILEPWKMIPESSVLLVPSKVEGMPAVIAEALIRKIPVLANRVGGIPEMCRDFQTCRLLPEGSKKEWLMAMEEFLNKREEGREEQRKADQRLASERFCIGRSTSDFLNFYQSL